MKTLLKSVISCLAVTLGLVAGNTAKAATFPPDLAGTYYAPIASDSFGLVPRGSLVLSVTASGASTGVVSLSNGKSYGFKVTLTGDDDDGVAGRTVVVKGKVPMPGPQALEFWSIRLYANGTLQGALSTSLLGTPAPALNLIASQTVRLATFSKASPAPWSDTAYTMAMTPTEESSPSTPAGAGYATLTVSPTGDLTAKMVLGDGTKLTAKAKPTADARYRLFAGLYTSGGYFSAGIDLDDLASQDDAVWNKPANAKDKKYKDGFSAVLGVTVREWAKLGSVKIPAGFTSSKNFTVDFSGEGLSDTDFATTLPDTARFTSAGKVQAVAGGASAPAENNSKEWNKLWTVSVNPTTGGFTGTQIIKTTVGSKTTTKKLNVAGVLLVDGSVGEDEIFALGQYSVTPAGGTEITGLVSFIGPLEDNLTVATSGTYTVKLQQLESGTAKPSHAPANGATVKFTLAEDLRSIVFNGVKLPLSGDSRPVSLSYTNATSSPMKNVTVIVYLNYLGEVQGLAASYNQAIVKIPPELRNATFQNAVGGTAGFTKL